MKAERSFMMNGHSNSHFYADNLLDGLVSRSNGGGDSCYATIPVNSNSSYSYCSNNNYIEHRVSKMDTLAGVAIKYGVEVADIRRMNGLVTDLQMFAYKSLQIPRHGRHTPSPVVSCNSSASSNGEQTPPRRPHDDILDSLQSLKLKPSDKVSSAMSILQGYYGLTNPRMGPVIEGTEMEMAVYNTVKALCFGDESLPRESPASAFSLHRKCRSLISLKNGEFTENKAVVESGDSSESDRSIRRRQKAEVDTSSRTPEILMKEESSGGGLSGRTGKGLALRSKNTDASRQNSIPVADSFMGDAFVLVRKSSSTSNLQQEESASSSIWPTGMWSDAIARPIIEGLPKPVSGRRNKAAMD